MSKLRNIFKRSRDTQETNEKTDYLPHDRPRKIRLDSQIEDSDHKRPTSLWEKLAEERLYPQLQEMGNSYERIDAFQKRRVLKSVFFGLLVLFLAVFVHKWFYVATPMAVIIAYKLQIRKIDARYRAWRFARQLNFSKFTRLVIPYLKASGGNMALYTIFNRILQRIDNEDDRQSLYRLMGEMGDNPASLKPFTDFAERSSGTDMSHLFMSTIFDFQQTTFNTSVIDELGKIAAQDMMESIDEIIAMKIRRFNMFPTKVTMSSFILVIGLGAALLFHNLKDINIDGGGLSFIEEEHSIEEPIENSKDKETSSKIESEEHVDNTNIIDKFAVLTKKKGSSVSVEASPDGDGFVIDIPDNILFDHNKSYLKSESIELLNDISSLLAELPEDTSVSINGHTDNTGTRERNDELSMERAQNVHDYLASKGSLDKLNVTVHGYSQDKPIASNSTDEGRQKNRRVEIIIK